MVHFPQNEFTQSIEDLARVRASGSSIRPGVASATPPPTVRSADFGQEVQEVAPLTPEEREQLDLMAARIGIAPQSEGASQPQYASLDAAIEASRPVQKDLGALQAAYPPRSPVHTMSTRLPDFSCVEDIDLVLGDVIIDGMRFPMDPADVRAFKQFAVETARDVIMRKMEEATSLLFRPEMAEDSDGGTEPSESTSVQQQPEGSGEEPTF